MPVRDFGLYAQSEDYELLKRESFRQSTDEEPPSRYTVIENPLLEIFFPVDKPDLNPPTGSSRLSTVSIIRKLRGVKCIFVRPPS